MGQKNKQRSSKAVRDLLTGRTNPLVTITYVGRSVPTAYYRSMGFMVETFSKGLRLVATCKHAVMSMEQNQLIIGFKNPQPTILQVIGGPIVDPEPEVDVAFFVVWDKQDGPTQPFVLSASDPPPVRESRTLYNAKNECEPLRGLYGVSNMQQTVTEKVQTAFCKLSELIVEIVAPVDTEKQATLRAQGFVACRAFNMVSRPGFSGSPIWDDQLQLYGMDIRGNDDSNRGERSDCLVCLPTSELYASRQRIETALQERLRIFK